MGCDMDKYIRAWIQDPFKKPEPKKVKAKFRVRCEHLTDDGGKFGCAILTGYKIGDCGKCSLYKPSKEAR